MTTEAGKWYGGPLFNFTIRERFQTDLEMEVSGKQGHKSSPSESPLPWSLQRSHKFILPESSFIICTTVTLGS